MTSPGPPVNRQSAEEMLDELRGVVPRQTQGGRNLNPYEDPLVGDVYVTPDGKKVVVPAKPLRRQPQDSGYYWDWDDLAWLTYGPLIGYPYWWPYRIWWWGTFYPGMFGLWGPWRRGFGRWRGRGGRFRGGRGAQRRGAQRKKRGGGRRGGRRGGSRPLFGVLGGDRRRGSRFGRRRGGGGGRRRGGGGGRRRGGGGGRRRGGRR